MNWYEEQINAGYLGGKRRPSGRDVVAPMAGVRYRVPLSDEAHIIGRVGIHAEDRIFLCGRSVRMDPDWYQRAGCEARWGEQYLLVATDKAKGCAACRSGWEAETEQHNWDFKYASLAPPTDYVKELGEAYGTQWLLEDKKLALQAAQVAAWFNGEVVDEQE